MDGFGGKIKFKDVTSGQDREERDIAVRVNPIKGKTHASRSSSSG